jgi:hypothetical protein
VVCRLCRLRDGNRLPDLRALICFGLLNPWRFV